MTTTTTTTRSATAAPTTAPTASTTTTNPTTAPTESTTAAPTVAPSFLSRSSADSNTTIATLAGEGSTPVRDSISLQLTLSNTGAGVCGLTPHSLGRPELQSPSCTSSLSTSSSSTTAAPPTLAPQSLERSANVCFSSTAFTLEGFQGSRNFQDEKLQEILKNSKNQKGVFRGY